MMDLFVDLPGTAAIYRGYEGHLNVGEFLSHKALINLSGACVSGAVSAPYRSRVLW